MPLTKRGLKILLHGVKFILVLSSTLTLITGSLILGVGIYGFLTFTDYESLFHEVNVQLIDSILVTGKDTDLTLLTTYDSWLKLKISWTATCNDCDNWILPCLLCPNQFGHLSLWPIDDYVWHSFVGWSGPSLQRALPGSSS